jgi:hypothetical protein
LGEGCDETHRSKLKWSAVGKRGKQPEEIKREKKDSFWRKKNRRRNPFKNVKTGTLEVPGGVFRC